MRYLDAAKSQVEVQCPDCGKFEMLRTEFNWAVADLAEPEPDADESE